MQSTDGRSCRISAAIVAFPARTAFSAPDASTWRELALRGDMSIGIASIWMLVNSYKHTRMNKLCSRGQRTSMRPNDLPPLVEGDHQHPAAAPPNLIQLCGWCRVRGHHSAGDSLLSAAPGQALGKIAGGCGADSVCLESHLVLDACDGV